MLFSQPQRAPSSIVAASVGCFLVPGEDVLLTATLNEIVIWRMGDDSDFETAPMTALCRYQMFASVMACTPLPMDQRVDAILVVTDACKWHIVCWNAKKEIFEVADGTRTEGSLSILPDTSIHLQPNGVLTTSRRGTDGEHLVLVCYWMDVFHLFMVREEGGRLDVSLRHSRDGTEFSLKAELPGPATQLLHWSFLEPPNDLDFEDSPMVVMLFVDANEVVQIECAAIKPAEDDDSAFDILQGPWGVTNVQPTAHSIFSCGSALGGGCVCVAPTSLIAVGDQGHRGKTACTSAHLVCGTYLGLLPTSGKASPAACWLFGSTSGEIHSLSVSPEKISPKFRMELTRVPLDHQLSAPAAMHAWRRGPRTLLVWVTESGHTSVLDVALPTLTAEGGACCPAVTLLCSPFEPSLGPIQHAIAVDELGEGETDLVVACGAGRDGCVRTCRLGVAVEVSVEDGPELAGCSRILPLALEPGATFHSHLLFSFDEQEETQVLSLDGHNFMPSTVPGFEPNSATLLVLCTPHGHHIQVTPLSVIVVSPRGGATTWSPRIGRISKAAAENWRARSRLVQAGISAVIAVGVGCAVYLVTVGEGGEVEERGKRQLENQVSALSAKADGGAGGGGVQVAVAEWVSNAVSVLAGWQLQSVTQQVALSQPVRSVLWWEAGVPAGEDVDRTWGESGVMVVGLGDGTSQWLEVQSAATADGLKRIQVGESFRVGETAVGLDRVGLASVTRDRSGRLYLHSSRDAVWAAGEACRGVSCSRVCGARHAVVVACLHTELMPDSLVWLNEDSRLHFGQIGTEVSMQWDEKLLGDTVVGMAHHQQHRCLIVQSMPSGVARPFGAGGGGLRMLDSESLDELWRMDLEGCQAWSAIAIGESASSIADKDTTWLGGLVFTASYVTGDDAQMGSRGSDRPAPCEGDAEGEDLTRKEVGIVCAFEVLSPALEPRRMSDSEGSDAGGAGRAEGGFGMRLVGLVEVGPVVTALHVVGDGVLLAGVAGDVVRISCSEVGAEERAARQGLHGIDELWVRCDMRVEGKRTDPEALPEKMLRELSVRDDTVWGVEVLGAVKQYQLAADKGGPAVRTLDCSDLDSLGELTCCRLIGGGRGLVGCADGTVAVVDVESAPASDDGGGAMPPGRCVVASAVDLRSGAISTIVPGRMGIRAMQVREGNGDDSRARPDTNGSYLVTTTEGAVNSVRFVDEQEGAAMLKVCRAFAAEVLPFVAPTHRHVWPRRNHEKDGVGDGLGRGAAVDGVVLKRLLASCSDESSGVAARVLKQTGVGVSKIRKFLSA